MGLTHERKLMSTVADNCLPHTYIHRCYITIQVLERTVSVRLVGYPNNGWQRMGLMHLGFSEEILTRSTQVLTPQKLKSLETLTDTCGTFGARLFTILFKFSVSQLDLSVNVNILWSLSQPRYYSGTRTGFLFLYLIGPYRLTALHFEWHRLYRC